MTKAFFIDLTRCTGCRGCQIACKQWKNLPAEDTHNYGSHQNPPDLSGITLKTVHFIEGHFGAKNRLDWVFFPEQCRHCTEPPCMYQAQLDDEEAVTQDEDTGAVLFHEQTKDVTYEDVRDACPYDIPRKRESDGLLTKCDMCNDRVIAGMLPSCVLTCPTGCMNFGDEDDMLALAEEQLEKVKKTFPEATLGDADSVRVIYLYQYPPTRFHPKAIAEAPSVNPMTRAQLFARLRSTTKNA